MTPLTLRARAAVAAVAAVMLMKATVKMMPMLTPIRATGEASMKPAQPFMMSIYLTPEWCRAK